MDHLQNEIEPLLLLELSWRKHTGKKADKNQAISAWVAPYQWKNIAFEIPPLSI